MNEAFERDTPTGMPGSESRETGRKYLTHFIELAGLMPDEAVLEPGCGTGRMAEPLVEYLSEEGSYNGFDVHARAIEWCQRNIQRPNFHFQHADVHNGVSNPNGSLQPRNFVFPYPDQSFDFAFLTSVFTHMLPDDVGRYLEEIRRVLRPESRALVTWYILNDESRALIATDKSIRWRFEYEGDGYHYDSEEVVEKAVAYDERELRRLVTESGLKIRDMHYGSWASRGRGPAGQDIVLMDPA